MESAGQRYWAGTVLNLWCAGFVFLATAVANCQTTEANSPSAGERESKPVLLSRLDLNRLQGEIICVYNFSSW